MNFFGVASGSASSARHASAPGDPRRASIRGSGTPPASGTTSAESSTRNLAPTPPSTSGSAASAMFSFASSSVGGLPRPPTVTGALNYHAAGGSGTNSGTSSPSLGRSAHRRARSTSLTASIVPAQLMSLSGVLNDPKALKFAKLDIGGAHVPVVAVKKVKYADFEAYIKSITGYHDKFVENRRAGLSAATTGAPSLRPRSNKYRGDPRDDPDSPSASLYSLIGMDKHLPASGSHSQLARTASTANANAAPDATPPLSSVPSVFFQPDFTLENPRIFDLVTNGAELDALDAAMASLATHTDTVEDHLTREIGQRSASFFNALTNLTDLHAETGLCVRQVQLLRERLQALAAVHARKALETVCLTQRKTNVAKLLDAVRAMHGVQAALPTVQALLQHADYVAALAVIADAQHALAGLRGVATMNQVQARITDLARTLGQLLATDFCDALLNHLRAPHLASIEETRARVLPLVLGLVRIDALPMALAMLQDRLLVELRSAIKKCYPAELFPDNASTGSGSTPFIKQLKSLTLEKFLALLDGAYHACHAFFTRTAALHGVLVLALADAESQKLRIGSEKSLVGPLTLPPAPAAAAANDDDEFKSSNMVPDPQPHPPMEFGGNGSGGATTYRTLTTACGRVVHAVVDLGHARCAKLLAARSEQNAQLSLKDFVRMYATATEFVQTTDAVLAEIAAADTAAGSATAPAAAAAPSAPLGVRSALQAQARGFIIHFHVERMKQLGSLVACDQWSQAEVLADFQKIVDRITDPTGAATDGRRRRVLASAGSSGSLSGSQENNSAVPAAPPQPGVSKVLVIGTQQFPVALVILILCKMIDEYLQVLATIPSLAVDVHVKLVELLLTFNNRTCQMVLGAGALQSAGLKSISAKHLAVTSQSIGAVLALVPYIRTALAAHLSEKQLVFLAEYDKVAKDYTDHQASLYAKLVAIMNERVTFHALALGGVDWEAQPVPTDDTTTLPPPTPAMDALVKETSTLHRVLARYLPADALRSVMGAVFKAYNDKLEAELEKIVVTSVAAKNALLIDVQFFIRKLNALEGADGPGSHLEVVVNNMKITDKAAHAAALAEAKAAAAAAAPPPATGPGAHPASSSPSVGGGGGGGHQRNSSVSGAAPASAGGMLSGFMGGVTRGGSVSPPTASAASLPPGTAGTGSSTAPPPPPPPPKDTGGAAAMAATAGKISASMSMSGFGLKSWATGVAGTSSGTAAPAGSSSAHTTSSGTLPGGGHAPQQPAAGPAGGQQQQHPQGVPGVPSAAGVADAALKTTKIASDWMKKYMKGGE
ncbi:hypothetical protein H9P43_005463 [Blastocladiella emersonii ATCC 22665]|nr:hypothetical protein H9P43_005463 [Blastocladiella emersonii ATCC 22665]